MKKHQVKKFGNSGHVVLSKNLVGKYVQILNVDDSILGLGDIQRIKFKIATYKVEMDNIERNTRIRNRDEILKIKSQRVEELERLLETSEKASEENDMVR